jgi:hypothetical protein
MWWAAVSRAVDQSSRRNKRNDRLAEGHDRVAGAFMVLRTFSDPAPGISTCHCLFLSAKNLSSERYNAKACDLKRNRSPRTVVPPCLFR